jgi:hypothetical protein
MLLEIVRGYRPVVVGAFVLDALIAAKHVFASFGLALTEPQADAIMAAVTLGVAFVVQTYTASTKYIRDGQP